MRLADKASIAGAGVTVISLGLTLVGVITSPSFGWVLVGGGFVIFLFGLLGRAREQAPTVHVVTHATTRPRVRASYSWRKGEDKSKPFEFYNAGDGEALAVSVPRFGEFQYSCGFDEINHLAPNNSEKVSRVPDIKGAGIVFATLPDMLSAIIHERARAVRWAEETPFDELKRALHVAAKATVKDTLSLIIVYVSPNAKQFATEYELTFFWFGEAEEIDLRWIRDD